MGSVTIGSGTYAVYGTHAELTTYASGSFVHATAYAAATSTDQARALVEATRLLVALPWIDAANADVSTAGAAAIQGAQELALSGLVDAEVFTRATSSQNVRAVTGKVGVEFFAPVSVGRFPPRVMDLIAGLIDGASGGNYGVSEAGGTDAESSFDDDVFETVAP